MLRILRKRNIVDVIGYRLWRIHETETLQIDTLELELSCKVWNLIGILNNIDNFYEQLTNSVIYTIYTMRVYISNI